ncbi:MAG: glycosyltransferase family 4 protein [Bradyrhizobiaceae bacterium]|nr:glycosyltransferase family 4 protein [Bradyrhizobiaceae bacterium]
MRILVVNWQDRLHPQSGGAEVHLHEIFGRIAGMGHHVTLLCCRWKGAQAREELDGIHVQRIGVRSTFNYMVPLWWLAVGQRMDFDIVVDDINKLPFLTPLYVRKPILALVHHFFGDSIYAEVNHLAGMYVSAFERSIPLVYAKTILCAVSESTKQECLSKGFASSQVRVIYNGIDQSLFPMAVTEKNAAPTIVYFGRLKRYKSVDHIIRALAIVRQHIPDAQLEVLGTGDELMQLQELAVKLNVHNHVHFRGFVSNDMKAAYLSKAHLAVNPSVKEGWGITNLEANACGTPVISADVPGLRDSVKDGQSGLLYPYGNIERLAELIVRLLSDSTEREQLSNGAVDWAAKFTWDCSAEQMLALCEEVCQTPTS